MKNIDYSKLSKEELISLLERKEVQGGTLSSKLESRRYQNLFRNITMGFVYGELVYNRAGEPSDCVYMNINPAFEKITGTAIEDCIGRHSRLTPLPIPKELLDKCCQVVHSQAEVHFDYYLSFVDKWLYMIIYPSVIKNGFVVLFNDISDRKQMERELIKAREKAEEADRLKSSFLANVSHEIRTPLNSIVGFSELIAETEEEEVRKSYYEIVKTNSNLLLHLINDILDLSKIEAGKMVLRYEPANLWNMCEELQQTHQLLAKQGVSVVLDKKLAQLRMMTDYNRLHQVYVNLLGNAIKNTESGVITLGYREERGEIVFYVRDTGRGIPREKLDTIFNRFVKVHESVQGFGLGLAISKSIVEKMGGRMEVDSDYGVGSEFRFVLPYTAAEKVEEEVLRGNGIDSPVLSIPIIPILTPEKRPLLRAL